MLHAIKSAIKGCVFYITAGLNTGYYLLIPKNRKIVVDGFFNKILGFTAKNNLGDDLNFYVLGAISGKKVFSAPNLLIKCSNILFIGSILQKYINTKSIIWGAGTIDEKTYSVSCPYIVRAVRGPLTRQWLIKHNIDCPNVYSDPALLLPLIYRPNVKKKYKYGIIPHYVDWGAHEVKFLCDVLSDFSITLINMAKYKSCEAVIDTINECEYVISSSLHGIIISDAYKIPNIWVEFSSKVDGNGFKFRDYFLSVNRNVENPLVINDELKFIDLEVLFSEFKKPSIDVMPFLKVAPVDISSNIINEAETYYGHE